MTPAEHAKAIEDAAEQYAYAYSIDDFKDRSKAFDVLQDAIWAGVGAAPEAAPDLVAELEEVKTVCAQAYQVVGILLADAGRFDSPEAEKILDNLGEQRLKHTDVLPWESKAAPEGWQLVQSTGSTQKCWCAACDKAAHHGMRTHMSVCPQCGSKRCEKALNHQAECSSAPKP